MDSDSLKEQIEIYCSCRNLPNMDTLSKTDAQITLFMMSPNKQWVKKSQTEIIWDSLNPNFLKTFVIDYYFEKQQHIYFEVVDRDNDPNLIKFIGSAQTTVGALFGSKNKTMILEILNKSGNKCGKLILRCDSVKHSSEHSSFVLGARNITHKRFFSLFSDIKPMIRINKIKDNQSFTIHETEKQKGNNVTFQKFTLNNGKLCDNDELIPFEFQLWDHNSNGEHKLLASVKTTLQTLKQGDKTSFEFQNSSGKTVAQMVIGQYEISHKYQFTDYIRGGLQLNLVTAIDFTGQQNNFSSNGHPQDIQSLHSMVTPQNNLYLKSLNAVGQILMNYDSDKLVPMYGFGGVPKFPQFYKTQVDHCFPLTGNPQDPNAYHVQGMIDVYQRAINSCDLSGPTLFSQVLENIEASARQMQKDSNNEYIILLILTDGQINDMEQTIKRIINCCNLPISIVIVGLGDADFTKMEILDGDDGLMDSNGRNATRDLVQFVPFIKFQNDAEKLAEEVLEEIPRQITQYFGDQHIEPKPPVPHLNDSFISDLSRNNSM